MNITDRNTCACSRFYKETVPQTLDMSVSNEHDEDQDEHESGFT